MDSSEMIITKPGTRKRAHAQVPHCQSKRVRRDLEYLDQTMTRPFTETGRQQSSKPEPRYRECGAFAGAMPEPVSLEASPYLRCGPDLHHLHRHNPGRDAVSPDDLLSEKPRERRSQAPSPNFEGTYMMPMLSIPAPDTVSTASSSTGDSHDSSPISLNSTSSVWTAPTSVSSHHCSPDKKFERSYAAEGFARKRQRSDGMSYDQHEWAPLELKGITPEQLRSSLASSKRPRVDVSEQRPRFSILRLPRRQQQQDITNPFGQRLN
ncbi:hypothetical protein KEM54_002332 [Ascosphaera aggregata]|nr:hypothetical protein KEM54_002332 [Ascosphaera aggregata]